MRICAHPPGQCVEGVNAASDSCLNPVIDGMRAVFVSQAGLSGDPKYIAFVDEAVAYAKEKAGSGDDAVALAIDRLAVRSQCAIQGVRVRAIGVDQVRDAELIGSGVVDVWARPEGQKERIPLEPKARFNPPSPLKPLLLTR